MVRLGMFRNLAERPGAMSQTWERHSRTFRSGTNDLQFCDKLTNYYASAHLRWAYPSCFPPGENLNFTESSTRSLSKVGSGDGVSSSALRMLSGVSEQSCKYVPST